MAPKKQDNSQDDLLKRVRQLERAAQHSDEEAQKDLKQDKISVTKKHATDIIIGLSQFLSALGWIYDKLISPVLSLPIFGKIFEWYKELWQKTVYVADEEGLQWFSKRRGGMMIVSTIFALWLIPTIILGTLELCIDAAAMALTYKKDEVWYLGRSEEIDPERNIFSAQGCATISCTDQTSIYFRIKPSLAHHIWSLYHNGNIFFPDFVAAGIQNDVNKCNVTVYGARWKFLIRNWEIYPQILSVSCVPITETQ